ncbi:potassium channel family protein [Candidatus Moduliflexota bacterium]
MKKRRTMDMISIRFWVFLSGLVFAIVLGTAGFAAVEGFSIIDAFYFSVVTITTVGFGDLHPVSATGKVLAIVMIFMGVGTFTGMVAAAAEMFLTKRDRLQRFEKLNMVIGAFYSEVGTRLLVLFSDYDPGLDKIRSEILTATKCPDEEFHRISTRLHDYAYAIDVERVDLGALRAFLGEKRSFMLRLVENPTLLEHEEFTDLLMAVFHLTEEMVHRDVLRELPETDMVHIGGDIKRVYVMLVHQWLDYMRYLKANYPYLFSLAMRTNPFDQDASPVVT